MGDDFHGNTLFPPAPQVPPSGDYRASASCRVTAVDHRCRKPIEGGLYSPLAAKHGTHQNVLFVAFDTETTGLNHEEDRIVEIGAVKFKTTGVSHSNLGL